MKNCKFISVAILIILRIFFSESIYAQTNFKFYLPIQDSLSMKYRLTQYVKSSHEVKIPPSKFRAFFCKMEDRYFQTKSGRLAFRLGSLEEANRYEDRD
ncbi:MAG: hypothetical protein IPM48_10590 [Saprospiraceae bacterium]|nr:hypothetical protein [Saprospiraceae bacterium]